MGFSDLARAGAKIGQQLLLGELQSFIPGQHTYGYDSPSPQQREIAKELENNYRQAAAEFQAMGAQRPNNKRIALCVGCNYPNDSKNSLKGCVNDATRWAELLSRNYDFQVILMTDDHLTSRHGWSDPKTPTKDNVLKTLRNLISQMQRGDCLAFTFSGHGTRIRDRDGDEANGYDECLVMPDARSGTTLLSDDVIYRECIRHVPEGCKVTAVFDCCRSGGALDLDWELHTSRDPRSGRAHIGQWQRGQKNAHGCKGEVTLITGCTSDQTSLEIAGVDGRNGALSTEMIRLLSRQPYQWTYANFMASVIQNVFNNPQVGKHANPQCPTLSSSIPFDVNQRMFGPDQLSGIQTPQQEHHHANGENYRPTGSKPQIAMDIPKYMMNLLKH